MTDVAREKYLNLMRQVEHLEDRIEGLETPDSVDADIMDPADVAVELVSLKEELAAKRNELARISDGCGTPRKI